MGHFLVLCYILFCGYDRCVLRHTEKLGNVLLQIASARVFLFARYLHIQAKPGDDEDD